VVCVKCSLVWAGVAGSTDKQEPSWRNVLHEELVKVERVCECMIVALLFF
jgi:hypothetical protein